jgi:hypothetical protein
MAVFEVVERHRQIAGARQRLARWLPTKPTPPVTRIVFMGLRLKAVTSLPLSTGFPLDGLGRAVAQSLPRS